MATTRQLTIAAMKGSVWVRFRDVANNDVSFQSVCGGKITVDRDPSGTTYSISSDTDHIRVVATIVGPSDVDKLFYWDGGDTYGWWEVEGYQRREFGNHMPADISAASLATADLGEAKQTNAW